MGKEASGFSGAVHNAGGVNTIFSGWTLPALIPTPLPAQRAAAVGASSVLNLFLLERHGHVLHGDALHDGGERVEVAVLRRVVGQEVICGE